MRALRHILAALTVIIFTANSLYAQKRSKAQVGASAVWGNKTSVSDENMLNYIVDGKDTIYIDNIAASKVYSRLPKQKGREWRKYYRLVHNFSKSYPYALVARKLVQAKLLIFPRIYTKTRQVCKQGPERAF